VDAGELARSSSGGKSHVLDADIVAELLAQLVEDDHLEPRLGEVLDLVVAVQGKEIGGGGQRVVRSHGEQARRGRCEHSHDLQDGVQQHVRIPQLLCTAPEMVETVLREELVQALQQMRLLLGNQCLPLLMALQEVGNFLQQLAMLTRRSGTVFAIDWSSRPSGRRAPRSRVVVVGLSSLSPAQYIARTVWPYQRRPNVASRQRLQSTMARQHAAQVSHGRRRIQLFVLFDGDELLDGGREKPSAKTMSIQSAPPEPERAGKGMRRTLRSLSASANRHGRAMAYSPDGIPEVLACDRQRGHVGHERSQ
jgi:hypothetical protein